MEMLPAFSGRSNVLSSNSSTDSDDDRSAISRSINDHGRRNGIGGRRRDICSGSGSGSGTSSR